ncbi:fimbrial protein [Serratia fonticola]|uniref:Fimbrial protein n=1 Tax=Serratia fonticola TaxID=47917 RepID=A0ABY9PVA8_SERFO|nr:fimbrial protein [Serratia fonticola]WMT16051.1 fimbrial protein [Serratia fonticola]
MKNGLKIAMVLPLIYTTPSWAFGICSTATPSVSISGSALMVQRDVKVGDPLSDSILVSPLQTIFTCPSTPVYSGVWQNFGFKTSNAFTGLKAGSQHIYATSVSGIGFTLGASQNDASTVYWLPSTSASPLDGNVNQIAMVAIQNSNFSSSRGSANIKLYKTGPINSGVLSGKVGSFIIGSSVAGGGGWATEVPINISAINVTVLACTLNTPSISVPLGDVQAGLFTGVGSTLGTKSFNLGLNCSAGARVNVSMSGIQNADTVNTSVLALTGAGNTNVAKGVGTQILYNGTPMKLGENLLLKTSAGGVETLGFQARYYQTLANVVPGQANTSATLNITYQ